MLRQALNKVVSLGASGCVKATYFFEEASCTVSEETGRIEYSGNNLHHSPSKIQTYRPSKSYGHSLMFSKFWNDIRNKIKLCCFLKTDNPFATLVVLIVLILLRF